jgi:hypothetical protein
MGLESLTDRIQAMEHETPEVVLDPAKEGGLELTDGQLEGISGGRPDPSNWNNDGVVQTRSPEDDHTGSRRH